MQPSLPGKTAASCASRWRAARQSLNIDGVMPSPCVLLPGGMPAIDIGPARQCPAGAHRFAVNRPQEEPGLIRFRLYCLACAAGPDLIQPRLAVG